MAFVQVLGYMSPAFIANNFADLGARDMVFDCQGGLSNSAIGKTKANLSHVGFVELCTGVLFAAKLSAFAHLVGGIVLDSAKKEMGRIDASSIVAAMANKHTIWDFAIMQAVRKTMGRLMLFSGEIEIPVSIPRGQFPVPTGIRGRLLDMFPKSFFKGACTQVSMMPRQKMQRIAFPETLRAACSVGDGSWLAAATFAEADRCFVRGMIHDVIRSFQRLTMPRDTRNVAVALLLVNLIIPKEVGFCHFSR